jgi:hypothetical protein
MAEERELEGLKREMEKLAECFANMGDDIDTTAVGEILMGLTQGETAEHIIESYGLDAGV